MTNKMTKIVNIYPDMPITTVNPPIRSSVKRVTKSISEIRACLMARATVEEILPNGKTIRLNISNYNKCNTSDKKECKCENCTCGKSETTEKSVWQTKYEEFLDGKNLTVMSRKQRRSIEAAARAYADAAVAKPEDKTQPVVVMGPVSVETAEEVSTVEEKVEEVKVEEQKEEVVKTMDIEQMSNKNE